VSKLWSGDIQGAFSDLIGGSGGGGGMQFPLGGIMGSAAKSGPMEWNEILQQWLPADNDPIPLTFNIQPDFKVDRSKAGADLTSMLKGLMGGGDGTGGAQPTEIKIKTTFDADTGPLAVAYTSAMSWGSVFDAATFQSTFDADTGPAAVKYTDAMTWGGIWDAATFLSTFDIDIGPAAVAYTSAFNLGNTWSGQVFTASFAIDLSGLYAASAAADAVAAHIAAVMPHSPAKEGPLREPISFDYIGDNFAANMGRMVASAHRNTGKMRNHLNGVSIPGPDLAGANGGRSGASDRPINVTVNVDGSIVGLDDFQERVAAAISDGIVEATNTHRRSTGG
jgi:hypothetical protein